MARGHIRRHDSGVAVGSSPVLSPAKLDSGHEEVVEPLQTAALHGPCSPQAGLQQGLAVRPAAVNSTRTVSKQAPPALAGYAQLECKPMAPAKVEKVLDAWLQDVMRGSRRST